MRAITVIEGRRRRGIVKSRVCEFSTFDSSHRCERLSAPIRRILHEISVIVDFHTGPLYGEEFL